MPQTSATILIDASRAVHTIDHPKRSKLKQFPIKSRMRK